METKAKRYTPIEEALAVGNWLSSKRDEIIEQAPSMVALKERVARELGVSVTPRMLKRICTSIGLNYTARRGHGPGGRARSRASRACPPHRHDELEAQARSLEKSLTRLASHVLTLYDELGLRPPVSLRVMTMDTALQVGEGSQGSHPVRGCGGVEPYAPPVAQTIGCRAPGGRGAKVGTSMSDLEQDGDREYIERLERRG